MGWIILSGLLFVISLALARQKSKYYYAFCGVLYYLITEYDDELTDEKIKELINEAQKHV